MMLLKARSLNPDCDWMFFHSEPPLAVEDRALIRQLEAESAQSLWRELVSADPGERHPMLLPRGHWTYNVMTRGPNWEESWEASSTGLTHHIGLFKRLGQA